MISADCTTGVHEGCNPCSCKCHGDDSNILIRDENDGYILAKLVRGEIINKKHLILVFEQKEYFHSFDSAMNHLR